MANEEQLSILKQGVLVWNEWRSQDPDVYIDLSEADLRGAALVNANLMNANLQAANLLQADLRSSNLMWADLTGAMLAMAELGAATVIGTNFSKAQLSVTDFVLIDLSEARGLDEVVHMSASNISTNVFIASKENIAETFLRGCGLSDWEVEQVKLYNPSLSNDEIAQIQYKVYDLRATQAIQISPLFISYSHGDRKFVDKIENQLNEKGVRFWRDIHDLKAGRIETQIDRAISQNRTVLLVLSEHSIKSDWVEHEVRTARGLEKDMGHDVLCPIALDDSWKSSPWPKRVMEQIMEYNILDFSAWKDDVKFEGMFRKLIDGLQLFYKDKSHGE